VDCDDDDVCLLDLETAEELYQRRITRILTTDFPKYFAVVTRIRHDTALLGPDGGRMSSRHNPQVQATFPPTALTKPIKVGLQVAEKLSIFHQNWFQYRFLGVLLGFSISCFCLSFYTSISMYSSISMLVKLLSELLLVEVFVRRTA